MRPLVGGEALAGYRRRYKPPDSNQTTVLATNFDEKGKEKEEEGRGGKLKAPPFRHLRDNINRV